MNKIVRKPLPNALSGESFVNPEVRKVVTLLMENIRLLKKQIEELQSAVEGIRR